jgi:hypothetical protein
MAVWKVVRAWDHPPVTGTDRDYARSFALTDGKVDTQATVEFAAGGSYPRIAMAAADVLKPYLEKEAKPPRRLVVARDGSISVSD